MKIIAHRGASGEFPENSLLAFEQAIIQQADGIELYAQYHNASGEFVLLHDAYTINIANEAFHFNELSLEKLLAITNENQTITTLDDALTTINGRCMVNIELKASTININEMKTMVDALKKLLSKFVQSHQFAYSQFIVSAFNHPLLLEIRQLIPQVDTAALIAHCPLLPTQLGKELQVQSVNIQIDRLNQPLVNDIHRQGLTAGVYTVDLAQDIELCLRYKVDAIFTNYPVRTKAIVENLQNKKN